MAKLVVWSLRAQRERKEILKYWVNRNKSNTYSKKLNHLFRESVELISEFPQIGMPADVEGVRIKVVRDYLLIYEEKENHILILTIWDVRQDPENLKFKV
jgi:addiction module RelE/StbE family toxin